MSSYSVVVDDNFHYMDEDESYVSGEFAELAEAVNHCIAILDNDLKGIVENTKSPQEIFNKWLAFGECPYIQGASFSASEYVKTRAFILSRRNLVPIEIVSFKISGVIVEQFEGGIFIVRPDVDGYLSDEIRVFTGTPNLTLKLIVTELGVNALRAELNPMDEIEIGLKRQGWKFERFKIDPNS